MKQALIVVFVMAMALSAYSAQVFVVNFDGSPATDQEYYLQGPGDFGTSISTHFTASYTADPADLLAAGARDYGWMWDGSGFFVFPDNYFNTGNYPDIVTPSVAGFQGGNAFYTCTGNVGDSQQHIGYYIQKDDPGFSMSGDFTAEAIFMLAKIGQSGDEVADSEYSLHNIFGTETVADSGAAWKFRVWPNGLIGGTGQLQLWTGHTDGSGGEEDVDGPDMSINTWYHVAAVYTQSTNTIELFLDGVSQGTANPVWGDSSQDDWWMGAWPNNPANRGLAGWIDAISLSNAALLPTQFTLPRSGYTGVQDWTIY